jgi:hypothetical protein
MAADQPTAPVDPVTTTTAADPATADPAAAPAPAQRPAGASTPIVDPDRLAVSLEMAPAGSRPWTQPERDLLDEWAARVTAAQHAHYHLMSKLRRRNLGLGLPVVILSALVGTALFATVANSSARAPAWVRLLAGSISVLAAVLAGVQTFLKFAERSQQHALAADWLAAVRRDIDLIRATPETERGDPKKVLSDLRKEINKIAQNAPGIGEKTWHQYAIRYGVQEPDES